MSTSKNTQTGVYLIVIDGLPEHYTWQDLKDFVRPEAEHEFWADLQSLPNSSRQKRGCIRTQRQKEAGNLYKFLARANVKGRRLSTVLWDISQSPPKQIAPNPAQTMSDMQAKWASGSTTWSSVVPTQIIQQGPSCFTPAALTQSVGNLSLQQRRQQTAYYAQQEQHVQQQKQAQVADQARQAQAAYYASQAQQPPRYDNLQRPNAISRSPAEYVSSQTGTPINVRDGIAVTVSRGVFVSGLNYKAREDDVKHEFSSVGDLVKCQLQKDPSTGKSKGVAILLYTTATEAQKAVEKYHHSTWMNKKIKVRIDKEPTTLAAPPRLDNSPLIVNGSRVP